MSIVMFNTYCLYTGIRNFIRTKIMNVKEVVDLSGLIKATGCPSDLEC